MNIATVVTIYHPDENALGNILSYTSTFQKTYLFDNTENISFLKQQLFHHPAIAYYHDGENNGIAKVLNRAALMAISGGYDWLLMMDQDSRFDKNTLDNYLQSVQEYGTYDDVAMFGVNVEEGREVDSAKKSQEVDHLITSGTLLNLSLFKKIGPFDENLFIDSVDHDYAIRVLQHGYKMIEFPHIHLSHTIGKMEKRTSIKTLFLVKKLKRIHSPIRCYYMYRNVLYLQKKYRNSGVAMIQSLKKSAMASLWRNFFYGGSMLQLVRYILLARLDFREGRMGKFLKH